MNNQNIGIVMIGAGMGLVGFGVGWAVNEIAGPRRVARAEAARRKAEEEEARLWA